MKQLLLVIVIITGSHSAQAHDGHDDTCIYDSYSAILAEGGPQASVRDGGAAAVWGTIIAHELLGVHGNMQDWINPQNGELCDPTEDGGIEDEEAPVSWGLWNHGWHADYSNQTNPCAPFPPPHQLISQNDWEELRDHAMVSGTCDF